MSALPNQYALGNQSTLKNQGAAPVVGCSRSDLSSAPQQQSDKEQKTVIKMTGEKAEKEKAKVMGEDRSRSKELSDGFEITKVCYAEDYVIPLAPGFRTRTFVGLIEDDD